MFTSSNPPESSSFGALANIAIPENYPTVPVIPLYRNPVFPKFVKLVEVSVKQLKKKLSNANFIIELRLGDVIVL